MWVLSVVVVLVSARDLETTLFIGLFVMCRRGAFCGVMTFVLVLE